MSELIENIENQTKEDKYNRLKQLCNEMKQHNIILKEYENKLKAEKEELKQLSKELGIDKYQDENVKVTIITVDKSILDEIPTLTYLKEHNLNAYIHTKEFFDYTELVMASTQNKIKIEDLAPFVIKKEEVRVNIK